VNYKRDENEEQKYKAIEEENIELKNEIEELKNELRKNNEKFLDQIQRLFGMLEVKHQIMMA
jgi:hypothetical protein